jgi:hypothetical protein
VQRGAPARRRAQCTDTTGGRGLAWDTEYKTAFRHFDKDRSGKLGRDEFHQALQSLGENLSVRCVRVRVRVCIPR